MMKKIDRRKRFRLMVDVETVGVGEKAIFDIGFAVFTKKGEIVEERSYLIKEVFEDYERMKKAYYFKKYPEYVAGLATGEFTLVPWVEAMKDMMFLIKEYNIQEVLAYNLQFDLGAIEYTNQELRGKRFGLFDDMKKTCVWGLAVETICQQKSFSRYCQKHGLMTESGKFYKSSAEAVYSYMVNNPEFVEKHMGLADVKIEVAIYARIARQHKKVSGGIVGSPYRKVAIKE